MINKKARARNNGLMGLSIKGFTRMERKMVKGDLYGPMELAMMENGN